MCEQEKAEQRARDWGLALAALDRAVQWIKDNQENLTSFGIRLDPTPRYGITVHLGLSSFDSERTECLRKLFSGKSVEKRHKKGEASTDYTLNDDALQLRFTWTVWNFAGREPEPETIVEAFTI